MSLTAGAGTRCMSLLLRLVAVPWEEKTDGTYPRLTDAAVGLESKELPSNTALRRSHNLLVEESRLSLADVCFPFTFAP